MMSTSSVMSGRCCARLTVAYTKMKSAAQQQRTKRCRRGDMISVDCLTIAQNVMADASRLASTLDVHAARFVVDANHIGIQQDRNARAGLLQLHAFDPLLRLTVGSHIRPEAAMVPGVL